MSPTKLWESPVEEVQVQVEVVAAEGMPEATEAAWRRSCDPNKLDVEFRNILFPFAAVVGDDILWFRHL
jgi:hypothetical protein